MANLEGSLNCHFISSKHLFNQKEFDDTWNIRFHFSSVVLKFSRCLPNRRMRALQKSMTIYLVTHLQMLTISCSCTPLLLSRSLCRSRLHSSFSLIFIIYNNSTPINISDFDQLGFWGFGVLGFW